MEREKDVFQAQCTHARWRQDGEEWKNEEDQEGWAMQRLYKKEKCSSCPSTRVTHALDRRRRYLLLCAEDPSASLKFLSEKRWSNLESLIAQLGRNRFDVQALLVEWAQAGWVEIEEAWNGSEWLPERVRLSPLLMKQKRDQEAQVQAISVQNALDTLVTTLYQWRSIYEVALKKHHLDPDVLLLLSRIYATLEEQEAAAARQGIVAPKETTLQAGGAAHLRWVAMLRGILDLLANPRIEHERVFSARWLRDSKLFRTYRDSLEAFVSLKGGLERIGLVKHTPTVLSWGGWVARWNDFVFDGRAGVSFTSTPADTIPRLTHMQVTAKALLVIENQTPFEILVQSERRDPEMLYVFGAGFPGQAQRDLVALCLRANPQMNWSVWTDYDLGGVGIQRFWHDWSCQEGLNAPHPYRWTPEDLAMCHTRGELLTDGQRGQLAKVQYPLAQILLEGGYSIEQEAILSAYQEW